MKKLIQILTANLALGSVLQAAVPEDSKIFTPYFDMSLTEAGYMPSNGNIFTGANIDTRVGLLSKIAENHGIFALYSFNYSGPSFYPQDTKQFTERSLSHGINLEYRYQLSEKIRLRPALYFGKELRRMGSNESWKNGLYNTKTSGAQFSADYTFDSDKGGNVTFMTMYRTIKFPNYTDLLSEFENPGANSEVSGGMQDQNFAQYSLRSGWNNFFAGVSLTSQDYKKQKVIEPGGLYGNNKQKDTDTAFDLGFHHSLWVFELYPAFSYSNHSSNQNFLRFKSATDTSPVLVKDAYSYKEYSLSLPLDVNITGKWAIGGALSTVKRVYASRPPRDSNNDYMPGKQSNTMSTITGSIKKKMNEVASVRLFYSLIIASSNNKFESYMPYNYTGNSFGITYNISY